MEAHSFCISRKQTKYMECKFSRRPTSMNLEVKIVEKERDSKRKRERCKP